MKNYKKLKEKFQDHIIIPCSAESELALKENGKIRQEGKDYIIKDGDIIYFKFNV